MKSYGLKFTDDERCLTSKSEWKESRSDSLTLFYNTNNVICKENSFWQNVSYINEKTFLKYDYSKIWLYGDCLMV